MCIANLIKSWFFRKVIVTAFRNLSETVFHHTDDVELVFKYNIPFFGRTTKEYKLDGKVREKENMIGKKVQTRCEQDNGEVRIVQLSPKYEPGGTSTSTFKLERVEGQEREVLVWRRVVVDKNWYEKARLELFFVKDYNGDRQSRK